MSVYATVRNQGDAEGPAFHEKGHGTKPVAEVPRAPPLEDANRPHDMMLSRIGGRTLARLPRNQAETLGSLPPFVGGLMEGSALQPLDEISCATSNTCVTKAIVMRSSKAPDAAGF